jgi:branched-chain amino acid transport system permease protein
MLELLAQSVASGIAIGCVYGLIGIGFCVIYNGSGIVNFAQGAFVMLGGMLTYVAIKSYGVPLPIAAVLAIVLVSILGIGLERIVVRPLWNRHSTIFIMILATLAAQIVVERATLIALGDQPRTLPMFTDFPPVRVAGIAISYQFLWIFGCSALAIIGLGWFFASTTTGKAMRACSIDRDAAALQGIPVSRMLALSFAISAALGALAGVLVTPTQYTAFNVGIPYAISGFIAAIVGGFGRPAGALVGGIVLGVAQALAVLFLGAAFKNVAALSILLLFMFFRPTGLLGATK